MFACGCDAAGVAAAQLRLGVMYEHGLGVKIDYKVNSDSLGTSFHEHAFANNTATFCDAACMLSVMTCACSCKNALPMWEKCSRHVLLVGVVVCTELPWHLTELVPGT